MFGAGATDSTERHEGMVAAIAFESVVKLLASGGGHSSPGVCSTVWRCSRRAGAPELRRLLAFDGAGPLATAAGSPRAAGDAVHHLPAAAVPDHPVVENVNEQHLRRADLGLPAYLLAINIFVIPIAIGGLLHFGRGTVDPDTFVVTLLLAHGRERAGAARLRRRPVGGDRHGHRGGDRAVDHGVTTW